MNNPINKLTPTQAIRAYCTQCLGLPRWNREAVDDCQGDQAACGPCPFFPYRIGRRIPVKGFRRFCLDCTGGDREYIRECPTPTCPCYPYRYGKNPSLIGKRKSSEAGMNALKRIHQTHRDVVKSRPVFMIEHQDNGRAAHGIDDSRRVDSIAKITAKMHGRRGCHSSRGNVEAQMLNYSIYRNNREWLLMKG